MGASMEMVILQSYGNVRKGNICLCNLNRDLADLAVSFNGYFKPGRV